MPSIKDILATMRRNPKGVSFGDLCKVCDLKAYQVKQVLKAIERLTAPDGDVEVQDNATK